MTVHDIRDLLDATVLAGEALMDTQVHTACGSDMMSDVLAYVKDQSVLITGLCNPQTIRTAEMMDIVCLVFVRGKTPDENMLQMAREREIAVLTTQLPMFSACGILYGAGLRGGARIE